MTFIVVTKEKLKVVGEKTDRNGDYKVSEAIKNIKMPREYKDKIINV